MKKQTVMTRLKTNIELIIQGGADGEVETNGIALTSHPPPRGTDNNLPHQPDDRSVRQ